MLTWRIIYWNVMVSCDLFLRFTQRCMHEVYENRSIINWTLQHWIMSNGSIKESLELWDCLRLFQNRWDGRWDGKFRGHRPQHMVKWLLNYKYIYAPLVACTNTANTVAWCGKAVLLLRQLFFQSAGESGCLNLWFQNFLIINTAAAVARYKHESVCACVCVQVYVFGRVFSELSLNVFTWLWLYWLTHMYNLLDRGHFGVEINISNDCTYLLKICTICIFFKWKWKSNSRFPLHQQPSFDSY